MLDLKDDRANFLVLVNVQVVLNLVQLLQVDLSEHMGHIIVWILILLVQVLDQVALIGLLDCLRRGHLYFRSVT